jgi:broad specificity phosphatase PhoE
MKNGAATVSRASSRLVLVRHAHTALAGTFCGTIDPPLSEQGLEQLPDLNRRMAAYPLTQIFSSPLQRTRQTAAAIAEERGLQIQYVDFLHELAFGSWEGLDWNQVMARDAEYAQRWLDHHPSVPAPGGEKFEDFVLRIERALLDIADHAAGGCAAVVTHAGVIRTFFTEIAGLQRINYDPAQCEYTSCCEIWRANDQWRLPAKIQVDEHGHLCGTATRE